MGVDRFRGTSPWLVAGIIARDLVNLTHFENGMHWIIKLMRHSIQGFKERGFFFQNNLQKCRNHISRLERENMMLLNQVKKMESQVTESYILLHFCAFDAVLNTV